MKKILLLSMMFSYTSFAQTILVGDFENWTITAYDDLPAPWYTSNQFTVKDYGVATTKKVTGFSSANAIRIETYVSGTDTVPGYFTNTEDDPTAGEGGMPYSQQPNAIEGYYRYNLPGNDSAVLMIIFKKNGSIVSNDIIKIKGTGSLSTFTAFNYPLSLSVVPDSVVILGMSSNFIDGIGVNSGSWIEFDSLRFTGPGITQAILNGTFEQWNSKSEEVPDDWQVSGNVTRSNDKYAGSYAAKLVTSDDGSGGEESAELMRALSYSNNTHDTLTGYYKYNPSAPGDSAMIALMFFNGGFPIGSGYIVSLPPVSNYVKFTIPIKVTSSVDQAFISIYSSGYFGTPAIGSELYIDDMKIIQGSTSVNEPGIRQPDIAVYPNPAKDIVIVNINNIGSEELTLVLFDNVGKQVAIRNASIGKQNVHFPIGNLPVGTYTLMVQSSNGKILCKKQIVKQ